MFLAAVILSFLRSSAHIAAFALYAYHIAQVGSAKLDFATLGASAAYVVLILSWLVTMLGTSLFPTATQDVVHSILTLVAIQTLVFAGADKCYVNHSASKTTDDHKRPSRSTTIDWSRRPLPITIVNVVHAGGADVTQNPLENLHALPKYEGPPQTAETPMRTTYSHWPGEV